MQQTRQPQEMQDTCPRVRVIFEEGGFNQEVDYVLTADVSFNAYVVLVRCRHDNNFDLMYKQSQLYTMTTQRDGIDLRDVSSHRLPEVVKTGDTLLMVLVNEHVPVRVCQPGEFKEYEPHIKFDSSDQARTSFEVKPLFKHNSSHPDEVFGVCSSESTTVVTQVPKEKVKKGKSLDKMSPSVAVESPEKLPFWDSNKYEAGLICRLGTMESSFVCKSAN